LVPRSGKQDGEHAAERDPASTDPPGGHIRAAGKPVDDAVTGGHGVARILLEGVEGFERRRRHFAGRALDPHGVVTLGAEVARDQALESVACGIGFGIVPCAGARLGLGRGFEIPKSMIKKAVLLFAGQGAQSVGMGRDLAATYPCAAALFARADAALGHSLSQVMFEGPLEELTRTSRCQPALYVHGLACLEVLRETCPDLEIAAAAGLSLGEFTAHAAAGTFDFESGLKLVAKRGLYMEEACEATAGSMAAMIGGEEAAVRALAAQVDVDVANLNAPGQIVLSGSREGIAAAIAGARGAGIRLGKELVVAGAYHSRLMRSAQDKLAVELAAIEIRRPRFPVFCNVEARPVSDPGDIRRTLASQVTGSVRWSDSMKRLLDAGHDLFLELGPGGVLAGLMGRIRKGTDTRPADGPEAFAALALASNAMLRDAAF